MLPDYTNCPVNLACSILKEFGAEYAHPPLACVDELLKHPYKNVVVMLFDGMGIDALERHLLPDGFFRKNLVCPITSVFPPTTVAATTSIETGLTPAEHGWLGWTLYFGEIDKLVNVFPNVDKYTGKQAESYHVANRYIPYKSVHEKIAEAGVGRSYTVAPFGPDRVTNLDEFFAGTGALCAAAGRKYIYAYWDDPDSLMHDDGCGSEAVRACMQELETRAEAFAQTLSDTLLIVTADHGHLDSDYYLITDYPEIQRMLARPLSIESRAAAFYIREEYMEAFPGAFREAFGRDFNLYSREEVKRMRLFGDGAPHPKFDSFAGDFIAAAVSDKCLNYSRASRQFVSNHAGLDEREMLIPVIAIERP